MKITIELDSKEFAELTAAGEIAQEIREDMENVPDERSQEDGICFTDEFSKEVYYLLKKVLGTSVIESRPLVIAFMKKSFTLF